MDRADVPVDSLYAELWFSGFTPLIRQQREHWYSTKANSLIAAYMLTCLCLFLCVFQCWARTPWLQHEGVTPSTKVLLSVSWLWETAWQTVPAGTRTPTRYTPSAGQCVLASTLWGLFSASTRLLWYVKAYHVWTSTMLVWLIQNHPTGFNHKVAPLSNYFSGSK